MTSPRTSKSSPPFIASAVARKKLGYTKQNESFAVVTFNPPKVDESKRAPLDIVICLDASGSMGESTQGYYRANSPTKMDVAKIVTDKIIDYLSPEDKLALVTFTSGYGGVKSEFSFKMDSLGKSQAHGVVRNLRPGGGTPLYNGLSAAVQELKKHTSSSDANYIQRIMMLTDGQANEGPWVRGADIKRHIDAEIGTSKIGVSCFGVGADHDADLLRNLLRQGNFYFVEDAEKIADAFGTELGSLVSLYATDVELTLTPGKMIESFEVLNDLPVAEDDDAGLTFSCHDLLGEQPYSVVVKFTTKASHKASAVGTQTLFDIEASLKDLRIDARINVKSTVSAEFTTQRNASKKDDEDVMKQVAVQVAAQAQKEARAKADKGDISGARVVLQNASVFATASGAPQIGAVLSGQVQTGYASLNAYQTGGMSTSSSLGNTFTRQTAGTGGAVQGGVDVDNLFANSTQKQTRSLFSIRVKRDSTP